MPREAQTRFREEQFEHHDNGRSLTDLLKELRDETMRLFRQEVALAKTEISDKAATTGRNVGYLAAGGLVAYAGALVLLFACVVGLYAALVAADVSHMTAGWLSPLIVGGVVLAIGYALVQKAIATLKSESLTPERTVETIQENTNWIKEKVS
jgi:NADH:ubiquinone oxidoreductase subunit 6 (subunit J)